jgi:hypothetical protein
LLPGGVTVKQEYNAAGYQYQTIADGTVISEIKAMDDAGRVTQLNVDSHNVKGGCPWVGLGLLLQNYRIPRSEQGI